VAGAGLGLGFDAHAVLISALSCAVTSCLMAASSSARRIDRGFSLSFKMRR
jgi:hypothetical protein